MKTTKASRISIALFIFITVQGLRIPNGHQQIVTAQADVAIVSQLEGSVWLKRDKKPRPIRESMLLYVGDVIGADDSGGAIIYQAYAPVHRLISKQSRTIAPLAPPLPQNALTLEQYIRVKRNILNAKQRKNDPSPREMGAFYRVLTLADMRNSTVMEREPTFNWTSVKGATDYVINVYDRNEKLIWSAETTETRLAYPENRPPLAPGDYKWEVTARGSFKSNNPQTLYDATTFTVVNEKLAVEIETDLAMARARVADNEGVANLVYISTLIEHKRFSEAEAELKASLERTPKDQTLWELLMETYGQMNLWGAREDARHLSEKSNLTVEMIRALKARR